MWLCCFQLNCVERSRILHTWELARESNSIGDRYINIDRCTNTCMHSYIHKAFTYKWMTERWLAKGRMCDINKRYFLLRCSQNMFCSTSKICLCDHYDFFPIRYLMTTGTSLWIKRLSCGTNMAVSYCQWQLEATPQSSQTRCTVDSWQFTQT